MRLELIFSIHRATHRIGLYIQRHAPDLTQAEAHILCHLYEFGDSAVSTLHRAFAHKRSTLTSVLDRLADKGYVTRELDPADRRSFRVSLTADGRRVAGAARAAAEDLERAALAAISDADLAGFRAVARALAEVPS